jgi:hypothetical protein
MVPGTGGWGIWSVLGILLCVLMIVWAFAVIIYGGLIRILIEGRRGSDEVTWGVVITAFVLMLVGGFGSYAIWWWKQPANRHEQFKQRADWEERVRAWNQSYYCGRCDRIFEAGQ